MHATLAGLTSLRHTLRPSLPIGHTALSTTECPVVQAAETLLCVGARPTLDRFGYSPLMHAVKQGSADMVELLLRKGLCQDKALWTPLVYAVMEVRPLLRVHIRADICLLEGQALGQGLSPENLS